MSFPRWWQAWKRPAAAASAAVVLSGLLATASWAQAPSDKEDASDREDRQQQAGDNERRDRSDSQSQSQRVRDEGEQRVDEQRRAADQAGQQQRRVQQNSQQSQQQARQSQQRSSSRDDQDDNRDRDRNQQQGQYSQGQRSQSQHEQGQYQSQQRQQYGQSQQGGRRDFSYDRSSQRDQADRDHSRDRDQHSQHGLTWSHRNDGRLVVDRVESDSAWDRIGLADGDRIVSINGNRIRSAQDFNRFYAAVQPGHRARIVVYRDGDEETLYWTPRQNYQAQHSQNQQQGQAFLGVQLDDRYEDSAVVKAVYRGSPAERAGLRAGDTIVSLNGQEVSSPHDLTDIVGDMQPGEEVHLQVARRQNLNTQVRLGNRSSDDVRQAAFQEQERRSYSSDQSSDDDDDRNSRRRDSQLDDDDRRDRDNDNDSNQSDD